MGYTGLAAGWWLRPIQALPAHQSIAGKGASIAWARPSRPMSEICLQTNKCGLLMMRRTRVVLLSFSANGPGVLHLRNPLSPDRKRYRHNSHLAAEVGEQRRQRGHRQREPGESYACPRKEHRRIMLNDLVRRCSRCLQARIPVHRKM